MRLSTLTALEFHLSGKHNQKTHGRGSGGGGRVSINPGMVPKNAGARIAAIDAQYGDEKAQQRAAYLAAGFHGKPEHLSRDEFNDLMEEGGEYTEGWRGVVTDTPGPEGHVRDRQIARDFIDGELHFPGRGIYGNGTYVATGAPSGTAADRDAAGVYGDDLIRMAIPKSIIETPFDDLKRVTENVADVVYQDGTPDKSGPNGQALYDTAKELVKRGRAEGMDDTDIVSSLGDAGRVATVLGIDGYTVKREPGTAGSEYTVVLNRAVVKVDRSVYDRTGINVRHKMDGYSKRGEPRG